MRKIFFLAILLFAIVSFKTSQTVCPSFNEYLLLSTDVEQAKWLKDNDAKFEGDCKTELYKFVFEEHKISLNEFNIRSKGKSHKSFNYLKEIEPKIKKYIKNYEVYLTFTFDTNGNIKDLDFVSDFQTPKDNKACCYSLACIRSCFENAIALKTDGGSESKPADVVFDFYVESLNKVIFVVEDDNKSYPIPKILHTKDFSDKPLSVKNDNVLFINKIFKIPSNKKLEFKKLKRKIKAYGI